MGPLQVGKGKARTRTMQTTSKRKKFSKAKKKVLGGRRQSGRGLHCRRLFGEEEKNLFCHKEETDDGGECDKTVGPEGATNKFPNREKGFGLNWKLVFWGQRGPRKSNVGRAL